jgi:DNA invertase Pin-like site-specific DNA recombinase
MDDTKDRRRVAGRQHVATGRIEQALRNHATAVASPLSSRHPTAPVRHAPNLATRALGYASGPGRGPAAARELEEQAEVIARECEERGLELLEVVHEREPANGKALSRPGLTYALERIAKEEAGVLVVSELSRITRSAAELGTVIQWINRSHARLVATAHALDTDRFDGRLAADLLVEVSGWEAARLSERTRHGLEAARRNGRSTGRPAVADHPDLKERIIQMRAEGMTLQAIADRLNEEGVPTVRGGAKWRHSSVQAAAGYKRQRPRISVGLPGLRVSP